MTWFVYDPSERSFKTYYHEDTALEAADDILMRIAKSKRPEDALRVIVGRITHRGRDRQAYKLQPVEPAEGGDA